MASLQPRSFPSFGAPEWLTVAIYSIVLAISISRHEPWLDEAQAWLIARDCSLKEIFLQRLHYEGTPGLWHLFLWILIKAHISYTGMHWVTALVAVAAIVIFLRYSPFPTIFRFLLPLTFFLQYQFAVVARSYVLFTLLVFAVAALFNVGRPRPVLIAVICGLLANTSLFGVCTGFGFFALYAYRFRRKAQQAHVPGSIWGGRKSPWISFLMLFFLAIYTALPTPDTSFGPPARLSGRGRVQYLLSLVTFTRKGFMDVQPVPPIPTPGELGFASHQSNSLHDRVWRFLEVRKGVSGPDLIVRNAAQKTYVLLCVLTFPISSWNWLALLFLITLLLWLKKRHQLLLLFPYLLLLLLCALVTCEPHSSGVLWITLIAVLWISLAEPPLPSAADSAYIGLCVALALVTAVQIAWTVTTVRNDYKNNYDMGWMAARFIKELPPGRRIAGFNVGTPAVEPYFRSNIFQNQLRPFWLWSKSQNSDADFEQELQSKPDLVVVTELYSGDELIRNQWIRLESTWTRDPTTITSDNMKGHPYTAVARFCGKTYMRFGAERQICYVLFEPATPEAKNR